MEPIEIVREVAARHGVKSSRVVSCDQTRKIVAARHEAVLKIIEAHPAMSHQDIADLIGWRVKTVAAFIHLVRHGHKPAEPALPEVNPDELIEQVAARHGMKRGHIIGDQRRRVVCAARREAINLVAEMCPSLSVIEIGRIFRRDHTTILHALGRLKTSPKEPKGTACPR